MINFETKNKFVCPKCEIAFDLEYIRLKGELTGTNQPYRCPNCKNCSSHWTLYMPKNKA